MAQYGVLAHAVSGLVVRDCTITDIGYAGIMGVSLTDSQIVGNTVQRIGMRLANGDNAYGIAISNYSGEPVSSDVKVDGNTVEDVPTWHALDTHSGLRVAFTNNTVRRASRGLFITDGTGSRATDITVAGNQIFSPSPVTYNLIPITLYAVNRVSFTGNVISGWGGQSPTAAMPYYDYGSLSTGVIVGPGNVVTP